MNRIALALAFAAFAAAGCASTDTKDASTSNAPRALPHELEATTGSNMRRRTPLATSGGDVTVIKGEDLEREGAAKSSTPPAR